MELAQEIIDAIRQAEQAAEQREAQAGQQAEEIIAEARSGAAAQKSELIRQAREKAVQTENAAKAQADRITCLLYTSRCV